MINQPIKKTYVYMGLIFTAIILLHYLTWLRSTENLLRNFFGSIFIKSHSLSVTVNNKFQYFENPEKFLQQYATCNQQLENKEVVESKVKILEKENSELKQQLDFVQKQNLHAVSTDVIGNDVVGIEKNIIVNAGKQMGVKLHSPVISNSGILIGKIIKVEDTISIVRLINDNQSKIQASLLNNDGSLGIVEGGYGLSLKMQFVPRSEVVHVDDQIITSGLESTIPRGLLIGKVVEVENEAYQGFQKITILPATDLSKLTTVSIITSS
jgi:rod shape-determining protein MreC